MLELNADRNVAEITMHGVTHELYYRTPTTQEMIGFQAEGLVRKGRKIVDHLVAARLKYGLRVLVGFKPGTIGFDGKAISNDPKDTEAYRKDWKELLLKAAPQLVMAVGQVAFESVKTGKEEEGFEFVSEVDEDLLNEGDTPAADGDKAQAARGKRGGHAVPLDKG